jgi:hypothetical protein
MLVLFSRNRMFKSRRLRCEGHIACIREKRNACMILVAKPEGKRPLRRSRHRWENIKMDLREIKWGRMDWIDLAQDRDQWRAIMNTAMNFRVP